MTRYLAAVLSVIAVGVLLIAYGLLFPRASAFDSVPMNAASARPVYAGYDASGAPVGRQPSYGYTPYETPQPLVNDVRPVRAVNTQTVVERPVRTRYVERSTGRNWKKTALVIGGSSAAGAGLGAIFGGSKGALIGAAIGGGASTIYEMKKN